MIITISREFGSGGRELGKRLADELGLKYYDKEIIQRIADDTNYDSDYIDRLLSSTMGSLSYRNSFSSLGLSINQRMTIDCLVAQERVLKEIARKGDCIIVGRAANAILADYNPFNIFVYANMDSKIKRCRSYGNDDLSDKELTRRIKAIDNTRKKYYQAVAFDKWGNMNDYNLCINTSNVEIKKLVKVVAMYIKTSYEDK